jgi:hypothetical protein
LGIDVSNASKKINPKFYFTLKKITTILAFLILSHAALQAQNDSIEYSPFAIEDATWVIFDDSGFYAPLGYDSYVIKIKEDSLHNNILYKKMWVANWIHENTFMPWEITPPYIIDSLRFFGLVRDDVENRRFVGIIPLYGNENNDQEVLIHDFGISVGDYMLGAYKLDSVRLTDIVVDTFYGKVRLAHIPQRRELPTIEGIGTSNTGPLCQNPAGAINEGTRFVNSYCVGSLEECGIQLQTTSTSHASNDDRENFFFYPNPLPKNSDLEVVVDGVSSGVVTCFNSDGKYIFSKNLTLGSNRLTLNHMPSGVYFLHFNGSVKKVVVI